MTDAERMELAANMMMRSATVMASVMRAYATIEGMKALNREREADGKALAYDESAFLDVIDQEGIGHNSVVATLTF